MTSARAVLFQAPEDLHAPFWLRSLGERVCSNGYRLGNFAIFRSRNVTERTAFGVVEQQGATLRADAYHWSVLRCGRSSGTSESYHEPEAVEDVRFFTRVADQATRAGPQDSDTDTAEPNGKSPIVPLIAGAVGAC